MYKELLTELEHEAIEDAGKLWNKLNTIVGNDETRSDDLAEFYTAIHAIQRGVMKQAAARAYPDKYRLLGETIDSSLLLNAKQ